MTESSYPQFPRPAFNVDLEERREEMLRHGIKISDLLADPDMSGLNFEVENGQISLARANPETKIFDVVSSDDPSMTAGDVISLHGSTISGGSILADILTSGAKAAFAKNVSQKVKIGAEERKGYGDDYDTVTEQMLQDFETHMPGSVTPPDENGIAAIHHFYNAVPQSTQSPLSGCSVVRIENGQEDQSRVF